VGKDERVVAPVTFLFDFNSPYAYLAAEHVDDVLPRRPRWQPIAFGALIVAIGKVPWSLGSERERGIRECERRARERGLPPLRWPPGWPRESYSILALRAALVADEHGRLREFSRAAYRRLFADGIALTALEPVLDVADEAGVGREAVREGVQRPEIKRRLRAATDEAMAAGVTGVPTVLVGERVFWGDDQLEAAAALLARPQPS
jgi:2-hydroxychromene-2-carboxylate isomerase